MTLHLTLILALLVLAGPSAGLALVVGYFAAWAAMAVAI